MPGLDINWFREDKGFNPNIIRQSLKKRFKDVNLVDKIIALDLDWRKIRYSLDSLKKEWNDIGKDMRDRKKANKADPCEDLIKAKNQNEEKQHQVERQEAEALKVIDGLVNSVGNIVHQSVFVSNNEEQNQKVRQWGQIPALKITGKRGAMHHHEVLEALNGFDPERGQKIVGHRGYFLKGPGVLLNYALINYGIEFMSKAQYTLVQPPFFMKKHIMSETCQLSDFDDQLYKVSGGQGDDDYYLIATSQQPISALHKGQWLEQSQLPIRYAGVSSCFRKQAGAHGKDNWGIFRVHQFEKIEQFIITKPQDSWKTLEEMINLSEEFYKSLKLPYKVISIVSGALNDAAAKKYDLQAWFPGYNGYRQLVSCSNCTDFQARNLDIRLRSKAKDQKQKKYVHMLNGTLCATERTLCCILQNYQTQTGLVVPQVLRKYVGTDFLPFVQQKIKKPKGDLKPKQNKNEAKPKQNVNVPPEQKGNNASLKQSSNAPPESVSK